MYIKKTLGFTDVRVINKLEEIKLNGGNLSQYVTQLILRDIEREQGKYTIEELIEMVRSASIKEEKIEVKSNIAPKDSPNSVFDLMKSAIDIDT